MRKRYGIILRTYFPKKIKIAVLESSGIKYSYVPPTQDLCVGTMISYYVARDSLFLQSLERIEVPLLLAREHIDFLHHIFELSYYFIPMQGNPVQKAFVFIQELYGMSLLTIHNKKLLLIKFFGILGIIPHEELFQKYNFMNIITMPVDSLLHETIELDEEEIIDSWLLHCITHHPMHAYFKTMQYIQYQKTI